MTAAEMKDEFASMYRAVNQAQAHSAALGGILKDWYVVTEQRRMRPVQLLEFLIDVNGTEYWCKTEFSA